jgi:uncharacterized surface protein with fasciclin (FAS1) repeats
MKNMKIKSRTVKFLSIMMIVAGFASCSSDDDNTPPVVTTTVVDIAVENGLTSLAAALEATNLVSTLQGDGPFTVFAPDNAAFDVLLQDTGIDLDNMSAAELALVTNILLNHVIVGETITSTDLVNGVAGYKKTAAIGPNSNNLSLFYAAVSEVVLNGQATVTEADKTATNGVLHIVNTVIALPTIATFATTNPALSSLVSALQLADTGSPTVPYIATVSDATAGPFTVFAPTNTAFDNLLLELDASGNTALGDLDPSLVDAVLLNHLVATNVTSGQLPNGDVQTLGGPITANNTEFTLTDTNGRVSNIVTTLVDIQAVNGVVHVLDKVLLPLQ